MGTWGESAFESDDALSFLYDLDRKVRGMPEELAGTFTVLRELLDWQPYDESGLHPQAELLAAVLSNDWSAYRVGGGSGLMSRIAGEAADPRPWLPDDALVLVARIREGAYRLGGADRDAVVNKARALAGRLERMAAEVRSSNPDGWDDAEARAVALEGTAGRLRREIA